MEKENFGKYDLTAVKLGEIVECQSCHEGYYVTDQKELRTATFFYCNKCGSKLVFEPAIDISRL